MKKFLAVCCVAAFSFFSCSHNHAAKQKNMESDAKHQNINDETEPAFEVLKESLIGGNVEKGEQFIQSQEEFNELWQHLHRNEYPKTEAPKIDFDEYSLVVLYFGEMSHGGFQADVTKVESTDKKLRVVLKSPKRDPMSPVTTMMAYPYKLIKLKKQATKPVMVEISTYE